MSADFPIAPACHGCGEPMQLQLVNTWHGLAWLFVHVCDNGNRCTRTIESVRDELSRG